MKKSAILMFLVAFTVVVALPPSSQAGAVLDISDPIQYDANTWYAYAQITGASCTWAEVKDLVSAQPAYNGLPAGLATFTDAQYNWFVTNEVNFTSPYISNWAIAWIGASNAGSGTYTWLNGQTIPSDSPHWGTGQPVAGYYGVTWNMRGYGDVWETRTADDTSFGNAVIQYSSVPEPATLGLLALGGLAMIRRRLAA